MEVSIAVFEKGSRSCEFSNEKLEDSTLRVSLDDSMTIVVFEGLPAVASVLGIVRGAVWFGGRMEWTGVTIE